jgi:hypothetical protein
MFTFILDDFWYLHTPLILIYDRLPGKKCVLGENILYNLLEKNIAYRPAKMPRLSVPVFMATRPFKKFNDYKPLHPYRILLPPMLKDRTQNRNLLEKCKEM